MIERDALEDMFRQMHANGIKTDQNLLWGYFFTDSDPVKLEAMIPHFKSSGFQYVDVYPPSEEDDSPVPLHTLHVEKIETHDVESLHFLNAQFSSLAANYGIYAYDGMDVGHVDGRAFGDPAPE